MWITFPKSQINVIKKSLRYRHLSKKDAAIVKLPDAWESAEEQLQNTLRVILSNYKEKTHVKKLLMHTVTIFWTIYMMVSM